MVLLDGLRFWGFRVSGQLKWIIDVHVEENGVGGSCCSSLHDMFGKNGIVQDECHCWSSLLTLVMSCLCPAKAVSKYMNQEYFIQVQN